MTWIRCARIVQMAQQSRFAGRTATIETADAIDAGGSIETSRIDAIVNVDTAIGARPTVHTNARVAAMSVGACGSVLTHGRTQRTFVHIILTEFSIVIAGTFAAVRVHRIDACATVLALIARAIVDVFFTVNTLETCKLEGKKILILTNIKS